MPLLCYLNSISMAFFIKGVQKGVRKRGTFLNVKRGTKGVHS